MCPIPLRPLTPVPEAEVEEVPLEVEEAREEVVVIDNLPNWLPENVGQEQGQGHYDTEPVHRLREKLQFK
uniref:Uncharacterized protein n=1 Tax=Glossina palpalis gambiensis TaxID=67801 RepID=A0A1B0AMD4_9MUSC